MATNVAIKRTMCTSIHSFKIWIQLSCWENPILTMVQINCFWPAGLVFHTPGIFHVAQLDLWLQVKPHLPQCIWTNHTFPCFSWSAACSCFWLLVSKALAYSTSLFKGSLANSKQLNQWQPEPLLLAPPLSAIRTAQPVIARGFVTTTTKSFSRLEPRWVPPHCYDRSHPHPTGKATPQISRDFCNKELDMQFQIMDPSAYSIFLKKKAESLSQGPLTHLRIIWTWHQKWKEPFWRCLK